MASEPPTDIDFWEFVSCAKCHLPYASEFGKSVPFWLTECGHIICNNHLNPDQSCASCGSTGILVVALQQELDAPMSDWFKPIPSALDSVVFAAKFQQEVMAQQIRYYRARHQQIRTVMEKLRSDNSELKSMNKVLTQQMEQMKQQLGNAAFTSEGTNISNELTNENGKRPLEASVYQYGYPSIRPRTNSSPLQHVSTPTRLTLPVGQHVSAWARPKDDSQRVVALQPVQKRPANEETSRPMSRQIRRYAYNPSETARASSALTRTQQVPYLIKTGPAMINAQAQSTQQASGPMHHAIFGQQTPHSEGMGPPPVPQARLGTPAHSSTNSRNFMPTGRRFVPAQTFATPRPQPPTSHGPRRFFPRTEDSLQTVSETWQPNATSSKGTSGTGYG
ncbi:hypothetical protein AGABI2DRAFT_114985 [Agaricus bisporus var. bisporus H97]|uniref:hypothetical protein n=1 Tax=Agaricus bisporus var. bisporus (strain H97 / ATCC MYA-4626 / FGSC 10389) TaxID=936046 RepID=UPI00029F63BF|nr:hypothetical protein AGABI2DRAFT_114985 [Agaricus bisporus var. bisporus H97]EKV49915.1 hypothetical protein AGABI2DRAFT_114985 [Agaricus bisporus var. bisporus H97]